jgi:hypothetical protein
MRPITVVLILTAVALAACGGGDSSPTAPTPVSTPTPTPTPVPEITFTPATASPVGAAMAIFPASRGQEPGMISLAITAHNLTGVYKVRGEVRWDPEVFRLEAWGEGDWLKQGGALVDWTFYNNSPGELVLFLDRPTTFPPAEGSGEIFLFRLEPAPGVTSGQSAIQWSDPRLFDEGFRRQQLDNVYGGTLTLR